jgi:copper(I)-binding protein
MPNRLRAAIAACFIAALLPVGGGAHDHAAKATDSVGALTISDAFARAAAVPGGASAAYMTIKTDGNPDRLVAAASPAAMRVELHTHEVDANGVARMRQVPAIPIAADAPAVLAPGGFHVMLMGLAAPLAEGDTIELTLTFETSGSVTVAVPVRAAGAPMRH